MIFKLCTNKNKIKAIFLENNFYDKKHEFIEELKKFLQLRNKKDSDYV